MCGIVAVISKDGSSLDSLFPGVELGLGLEGALNGALDRIDHRGPDGRGIWVDERRSVALAHCRLAINDLSPSGTQPLHSPSGVHAVVNGELYDYDALSALLSSRGHVLSSRSDSELVLYLYEEFGLGFTRYLRGEFAIVLHDGRTGETILLRDRYGIKPLFVREDKGAVMVAAEIKAFLGMGLGLGWEAEWDVGAIVDGGWGQDTRTLFKGVSKLRPGHYMRIKDGVVETREYWDAEYPDKTLPEPRSEAEMISRTRELLLESVALRLRADVPIGIYLSGGIDSSALAGIAAHLVHTRGLRMGTQDPSDRICCFSIAFDAESGFDESDISERTATHLGVRFVKQHMDEQALAERFEDAVYACEHHNHDLNFVGKYALSEVPRREGYKVVLTGEGADEHFGGYPLFLPDYLSGPGTGLGDGLRESVRAEKLREAKETYEAIGADGSYFDKTTKRHLPLATPSAMLAFTPPRSIFKSGILEGIRPAEPLDVVANNITPRARDKIENTWHPLNSAMYVWGKGHLANQFLSCLGDRVEMAHSVEARTPFLDHRLTAYVNDLPPSLKIRAIAAASASGSRSASPPISEAGEKHQEGAVEFVEKYGLREAVRPFVTPEVYERRKHAYTAPTTYPADGPVNTLLRRLVTRDRVERLGFVSWPEMQEVLRRAWDGEVWAWRQMLLVAEWTVLGDRFAVRRYEREER